jgi:hypothetical protein
MSIKKFEDADEEMMEYARTYVDGMEARERYDPAKAKAYYQRNRDAILDMNKRYYANHRTEYIEYLRAYWGANREILNKRYKLHKLVNRITKQKEDTRGEWAIEREAFVNQVVPDIGTVPLSPASNRYSRKTKAKKPVISKPMSFVIRKPTEPMTFD